MSFLQKNKSETNDETKAESKLDNDNDNDNDNDDVTTNGAKADGDNDKNDGKDKDGSEKKDEMGVVPMQQNFGVYPKKQEREYNEEEVSTLLDLFEQGQKSMDNANSAP